MGDTVDNLFRKFLTTNINEALSSIPTKGSVSKEKIKAARKSIKKVRTILRLLSSSLKSGWVKTEEEILKDISKQFKDLRNVFVAEEVFKDLLPLVKKEKKDCDIKEVLSLFESLEKEALLAFQSDEKKRKAIIGDLQVAYERLDEMLFKSSPWGPIIEEFSETYRISHKLGKEISKNSSDTEIVELRKCLNFLCIELSFLAPYSKSDSKTHLKNVETLSNATGHAQDTILIEKILKENKKHFQSQENLKEILTFLEGYKHKNNEHLKILCKDTFQYSAKEYAPAVLDFDKIKLEKEKFKEKKLSLF